MAAITRVLPEPSMTVSLFLLRLARPALAALSLLVAPQSSFAQTPAPSAPPASEAPSDPSSADVSAVTAIELASRPALTLSGSAEWDDGLRAVMDALDKVRDEMAKAGLQPGGRPLSVFTETDDQGFKFTAMMPLVSKPDAALTLGQNVKVGETPGGKAMKFEHRGSYDDIDTSYEAITAYLDEKGLEARNLFIEEYLTSPKSADDSDLEVDIYVFLK
jgi:effector-binding domain-containing protein